MPYTPLISEEPEKHNRVSGATVLASCGPEFARAALRYQHVIDGHDADIVAYPERFGSEPARPAHDRADLNGWRHAEGTDDAK